MATAQITLWDSKFENTLREFLPFLDSDETLTAVLWGTLTVLI
jgi:hypothetical protein